MPLRDAIYNGIGLTPQSGEEDDQLNAIMDRLRMASMDGGKDDSVTPGFGMLVQGMPKRQFPDAKSPSTSGWSAALEPSPRPESSDIPRDMSVPQTAPIVRKSTAEPGGPPSEANPKMAQAPQAQPQQRGTVPQVPQPDFWDRLGAFSRGYNTGGLVGAIADGMGSGLDRQVESQNLTANALVKMGVAPELVTAATRNPDIMKALVTSAFNKQNQPVEWKIDDFYDEKTGRKQRFAYNPRDPSQRYNIGGQAVGREQGLNPTEQKTLNAAEDEIPGLEETIENLKLAQKLNPKTFTGYTAGLRGWAGTALPEGTPLGIDDWVGGTDILNRDAAKATNEWKSIMSKEAIEAMANTLKGATTNFELEEFKKILADPDAPVEQRKRIIDNMVRKAERRLDLNKRRVEEMRGGGVKVDQTPKPEPEPGPAPAPTPTPEASQRGLPKEPPANAQRGKDGKIYLPDPNRPGKWVQWED